MNEKDIEILERLVEERELVGIYKTDEIVLQAIENLINRNKELEKENEELLEVKISASANNRIMELEKENKTLKNVVSEIFNSEDVTDKYIPISLVEEKIEELDRKIKYEDNEKVIIWLHKQRKILQELLEE